MCIWVANSLFKKYIGTCKHCIVRCRGSSGGGRQRWTTKFDPGVAHWRLNLHPAQADLPRPKAREWCLSELCGETPQSVVPLSPAAGLSVRQCGNCSARSQQIWGEGGARLRSRWGLQGMGGRCEGGEWRWVRVGLGIGVRGVERTQSGCWYARWVQWSGCVCDRSRKVEEWPLQWGGRVRVWVAR